MTHYLLHFFSCCYADCRVECLSNETGRADCIFILNRSEFNDIINSIYNNIIEWRKWPTRSTKTTKW